MAAGCSDGMAHNIRFIRSPPASLSVCERHARQPRRAEKGVFEEGDAEVLFRKTTPIAARTPHLLPSLCYGRQVVSSRVQAETRQNSPQHQSSPRRLIKRTAEKQVWRTVMAGSPPGRVRPNGGRAACDSVEIFYRRQRRKPRFAL